MVPLFVLLHLIPHLFIACQLLLGVTFISYFEMSGPELLIRRMMDSVSQYLNSKYMEKEIVLIESYVSGVLDGPSLPCDPLILCPFILKRHVTSQMFDI